MPGTTTQMPQGQALSERVAGFGLWRLDIASHQFSWSPGMFRMLGADPDRPEHVSELSRAMMSPEETQSSAEQIRRTITTGEPFLYRSRVKTPDRGIRIIEAQGEAERDAQGAIVAVIGICRDVTRHHEAEAEHARLEKLFRLVSEGSSNIILLRDRDNNVTFCSEAHQRILGMDHDSLRQSPGFARVHPDDAESVRHSLRIPERGEEIVCEFRMRHADGHYIWLETVRRSLYDDDSGEWLQSLTIARDVTERKAYERKLMEARIQAEAASKAKSTFLANMSHELRTPLNAIIGFSDIIHRPEYARLGVACFQEYAGLINGSAQHLLDLITDILDISRIEAGKWELQLAPVNLAHTVEECMEEVRERAREGRITLLSSPCGAWPALIADQRAVRQVVLNLLSNAVKFTAPGGEVRIDALSVGRRVHIRVADTGIGIAEKDLARIGQPFERINDNPAVAMEGTGLGLAVTRALVESHGGRIQIQSREGEGTTVIVELPAHPEALAAA
jgi:PAS domain S-box-containing protein